ncbi:hypothetical protein ACQ4PT_015198 [Festuca glaucescens]
MVESPLLSAEKPELRHGDVLVITLPDHQDHADDGPSASREHAAWRAAAAAVMALAAFALAGHCYRLHYDSPQVAVRLWGEDWKLSAEGASSSFLLPLYPKKPGDGAGVKGSTAAVPERRYYTSINIGNPARPYFLDVDTGTDLTWIQCDAPCTNCTKGPHPLYKPTKGNMVHPKDSLCQELQGNQNYCDTCKQCEYEIAYADRSSSSGVLARDSMQLITADDERENVPFVFGCAYDQQGKLLDSTAGTDGVLGLSNGAISLPTQLANQGIISNVFGHCIPANPTSSGYMFLGDEYILRWGMTWVPIRNGPENVYSTEVQKVNYGGQELNVRRQAGKLTQLEDVSPGFVHDDSDQTLPFCMKPNFPVRSVDDVKELFKPLQLQFRKRWFVIPRTFTISPENYLIISEKGNVCLGVLDGTEIGHRSTIIIGDASLRGKLVVYDNDENQMGWAQSDCTRPQKESRVPSSLSRALHSQLL